MIFLFICLQLTLLFFMLFHDWISLPPLNDIQALNKTDSTFYRLISSGINGMVVLIPLMITLYYYPSIPFKATTNIFVFYFFLTLGTLLSWWVPYFFGSSEKHKQDFSKFKNTHHFLPAKKDHVIPNTLHVILHLQVWFCLVISIYLLLKKS